LNRNHKTIIFGLFGLVILATFGPVTYNQIKFGDYQPHLQWARELGESGYLYLRANILFQRLVLVVRDLLPFNFLARVSPLLKQIIDIKSFDISAFIVIMISYLSTALILVKYMLMKINFIGTKSKLFLSLGLTLILLFVGPLSAFTFPHRQYLGYITGNPFHNPTYLLARPFALLFFIVVTEKIYSKPTWKIILICSFTLILSTLAKPNFTLSIVPAIFLMFVLIRYREIKNINLPILLGSVAFTSIITLAIQYVIMYTGERGDRVIVAPFQAILIHTPNVASVLFFTVMSIVFPLIITFLYWKNTPDKTALELAWVNFGISILYAYLLAEQTDMATVNFWWTPMMAVFLLFVVTIPIFFQVIVDRKQYKKRLSTKEYVSGIILISHLFFGVAFYISSVTAQSLVH
jgi:hypothetical protein